MLKGRDIICFSSIDWDFIWQGHQEIMSALATNGNRVLFVENTGIRRPGFSDIPRLLKRLSNWRRGIGASISLLKVCPMDEYVGHDAAPQKMDVIFTISQTHCVGFSPNRDCFVYH